MNVGGCVAGARTAGAVGDWATAEVARANAAVSRVGVRMAWDAVGRWLWMGDNRIAVAWPSPPRRGALVPGVV